MNDLCGSPTSSGHPCGYPSNACPLHVRVLPATNDAPFEFDEKGGDPLRPLARDVIEHMHRGKVTPLDAFRWLRVLASYDRLPPPKRPEEEVLREVELRGVIMNGCPPRNPEEWELAAAVFGPDGIAEFRKWEAAGRRM